MYNSFFSALKFTSFTKFEQGIQTFILKKESQIGVVFFIIC